MTAKRELADFDPTTGHLHTCMAEGDPDAGCAQDCAGHLYVIAQEAEYALTLRRGGGIIPDSGPPRPAHPNTMAGRTVVQSTTDPVGD